jgi:hypothetical protein
MSLWNKTIFFWRWRKSAGRCSTSRGTTAKDVAGWDSMTNLFLIDAIERRFGFKFKLEEILNAQNVGELCAIVQNRGLGH